MARGIKSLKDDSYSESFTDRYSSQFENKCCTEICMGSEAGSYLRLIDFVYHSISGLRVIRKKKRKSGVHAGSLHQPGAK